MGVAFRAALLVAVVGLLAWVGPPVTATAQLPGSVAAALAATHSPAVATTPYGNLSIPLALGNSTFAAGTHVVARYQFQVVSWPVGLSNLTVWVYSEQVSFPTSTGGTLRETIPAYHVTILNSSLSDPNATSGNVTVGAGGVSFASGSTANLSSQLLAVMVSASWGTLKMSFRWDWESIPVSGATSYSSWSAFQTITPPEHIDVQSAGPSRLTPGTDYTVCIAAPTHNRTLSLHMEVANPYLSFAWNNTHVPGNGTGSYCWGVKLPLSFNQLPTALLVHLWEYNTLPSILAIFHTEAVAQYNGTVAGKISPASATSHLGSSPLNLSSGGGYRLDVAPGTYTLGANLTGYRSGNLSVTVSANRTTWANLTLTAIPGTLTGTVAPSRAQVSVDGKGIIVNATSGAFSTSLPVGKHLVHAQASGYVSLNSSIAIVANATTTATLNLTHLHGWLAGTLSPSEAALTVDGTVVPIGVGGKFNVSLSADLHSVRASEPGYTVWQGNLSVHWNRTTQLAITLKTGWVAGTVAPGSANLSLNGVRVHLDETTGKFNVSHLGGTVWIEVSARGYLSFAENGTVVPGATLWLSLALNNSSVVRGVLVPATATLRWDDRSVLTSIEGRWSVSTSSGAHWLNATAPGYLPQNLRLSLRPAEVVWENLTLSTVTGLLNGFVSPVGGSLTVNGVPVSLRELGAFSLTEAPGKYLLNASGTDHSPVGRSVQVQSGVVTWANLTLLWNVGWLDGTIVPTNASVSRAGHAVVTVSGTFNVTLIPGAHVVTAREPGYVPWNGSIVVVAGQVTHLELNLASLPTSVPNLPTPPVATPPAATPPNPASVLGGSFDHWMILGPWTVLLLGVLVALGVIVAGASVRRRRRNAQRQRRIR